MTVMADFLALKLVLIIFNLLFGVLHLYFE